MRIPQYGIHNGIKYSPRRKVFRFCEYCGRIFFPKSNRQRFCQDGVLTSVTGYVPQYSNIKYHPYRNYSVVTYVNCKEEHEREYQQEYQREYRENNIDKLQEYNIEYHKTYNRGQRRAGYWGDWYRMLDPSHPSKKKIRYNVQRRNNKRQEDFEQEYKYIQWLKWKAGLKVNYDDPDFS